MSNRASTPLSGSAESSPDGRLDSWKEIAAYFRREVRTVQRWEKSSGLPVHRLQIGKQCPVYAYKAELDAWYSDRRLELESDSTDQHARSLFDIPRIRLWAVAAVLIAMLSVGAYISMDVGGIQSWLKGVGSPQIHSLAVLPLQNLSSDPAQEYFSDGMTDSLITDLAQIGSVKVISRTSSMRYKKTDKSLPEIARELNVDGVVDGTVQRSGDRVRVTVQFVHGASDKHMWARSYDRELRDALKLQEEISRDVAEGISLTLAESPGRGGARPHPLNIEAYDDYLKGRSHARRLTEHDLIQGAILLERSIERDPNFAPAYAELAVANSMLAVYNRRPPREVMPKAKAAAMRAIALDENLADGHSALGLILGMYEWDWTGQERELKQAIRLEPNSSFAHVLYALHLITMGRRRESVQELNTALELDPYSPLVLATASFVLVGAHEFDDAVRQARRAVEIDPNYVDGHLCLASALGITGKNDEAFKEWLRFLSLEGDEELAQELGSAAKNVSNPDDPGRKLAHITLRYYQRKAKSQYVAAITMALAYMDLGDKDKMFEWLNKAYDERSTDLYPIALYPNFEPLHSEPRFQDLVRRMNLPQ
jgi:TolB-like protein